MGSAYLMIKDDLRGLIENGGYAVGELIPSQSDLAETYGVSAPTVKRAVELLAREGFLEAVAGGYVVARRRVPQGYATTLRSYYEERSANTSFPETKIIRFCTVGASDLEARRLGIAPGAPVYRTVRLRYADGKPFVFLTNCTPCEYFPELASVDLTVHSLYSTFDEMGRPALEADRTIEILRATTNLCALLDVQPEEPLFKVTTMVYDEQGVALDFSEAVFLSEGNSFHITTRVLGEGLMR